MPCEQRENLNSLFFTGGTTFSFVLHLHLGQLLVQLDATPQAMQRLDIACRIGLAQGCAITALYAVTPGLVGLLFLPEVGA